MAQSNSPFINEKIVDPDVTSIQAGDFVFANIWKTAACPAENIATALSKTLIEKGWMYAGSIVGAIVLVNEFSDLLGTKATVKRH